MSLLSNNVLKRKFTSTGPVVIETFTSSTTWTCPPGVYEVFAIVVAGGGGSGGIFYSWYAGDYSSTGNTGGGGGGQVVTGSLAVVPGESYSVLVGAGGSGGNYINWGSNGGHSYFTKTLQAAGGGGGASSEGSIYVNNNKINEGRNGGNGGGSANNYTAGSAYISSAGYAGSAYGGGGGAGGAASGYISTGWLISPGGAAITVEAKAPSGRSSGTTLYLAGGGATGASRSSDFFQYKKLTIDKGGIGGGTGSYWTFVSSVYTFYDGTAGLVNTGGGGGGVGGQYFNREGYYTSGKSGGSGVVYLVYERSPL